VDTRITAVMECDHHCCCWQNSEDVCCNCGTEAPPPYDFDSDVLDD